MHYLSPTRWAHPRSRISATRRAIVVFLLTLTALALFIGVAAYFGAFVAGILAGDLRETSADAHDVIRRFSFAFFIPIYFAIVGLRLDLVRQFDVPFFPLFLATRA